MRFYGKENTFVQRMKRKGPKQEPCATTSIFKQTVAKTSYSMWKESCAFDAGEDICIKNKGTKQEPCGTLHTFKRQTITMFRPTAANLSVQWKF